MRAVCLFLLFFIGWLCQANRIPAYYQTSKFSDHSIQAIQLEVLIAGQLFDRVQQKEEDHWVTLFQKEQMKTDARHALNLYSRILNHIADPREKSKTYFRMGYLHEVLNQSEKASEMYQKILSQSKDFRYSKMAYQKFNSLKKRKSDVLNPSFRRVISISQVQKPQVRSLLQTESHIIKARSHVTSQEWNQSLKHFKEACQKYTQSYPCVLEKCGRFPSMIRSFLQIVDKKANSDIATQFQKVYLNYFPRDFLVNLHAAQTAFSERKYEQAVQIYEKYILLEKEYIRKRIQEKSEMKTRLKQLEPVFYLMQEVAHQSKNDELKIQVYDFYLSHSLVRDFESRVFFLKNVALFNKGKYISVAPLFRQISLSEEYETSIREQAALYALKSLVHLKQTHTAQKWGTQLSSLFPHRKSDFEELIPQS